MRKVHIFTAATMGGVRDARCGYAVRDAAGAVPDKQVETADALLKLLSAMRPESIIYTCTLFEQSVLNALMDAAQSAERTAKALH